MHELEGRLDQEIQSRLKTEEAAREALFKFESLGQSNVLLPKENEPLLDPTKTDQQDLELVDQAEEKCQVPADVDDMKPNAAVDIKPGHTPSTSLEINDDNEQVVIEVKALPTTEQEIGGHNGGKNLKEIGSQDVKHDGIPTSPTIVSSNGDSYSSANAELKRQERRLILLSIETFGFKFISPILRILTTPSLDGLPSRICISVETTRTFLRSPKK